MSGPNNSGTTSSYLDSFGVHPDDQNKMPTPGSFPARFNPNAKLLWTLSVEGMKPTVQPNLAWADVISRFLVLCDSQKIFPFFNPSSSIDQLTKDLAKAYDSIYKVLTSTFPEALYQNVRYSASVEDNRLYIKCKSFLPYRVGLNVVLQKAGFVQNPMSTEDWKYSGEAFIIRVVHKWTEPTSLTHLEYEVSSPIVPPGSMQEIINRYWMPLLYKDVLFI